MKTDVIRIGNSKGIRIPAVILKECNITDTVEMEVKEGKIVIIPVEQPRKNWDVSFKKMHFNKEDELLIDYNIDSDLEDWEW